MNATEHQKHQDWHQDKHQVELTTTQIEVLKLLRSVAHSRKEIFAAIGELAATLVPLGDIWGRS